MKNTPSSQMDTLNLRTQTWFSRLSQLMYENRYCLISALVFGFFSYMFTFTNKLVIHDDLTHMFNKGFTVSSGRWGLSLLSLVLPDVSMPWFHGVITILLIAPAVCIAVRLLSIRSPLLQVLTAGLVICFPSLIGTFGYMFTSSSYGAAFLLAVLSVWCFFRLDLKGLLGGLLCCILSLSIYQAYISVTVTLLVLVLMQKTMYTDTPVRKIFRQGLEAVGFLILSLGLYWGLTWLIQRQMGVAMNGYAATAVLEDSLLSRPVNCLKMTAYILLLGYKGLVHEGFLQVVHLIFLGIVGFELVVWCCSSRKKDRILMLVFLCALLPFALNAVLLFTSMSSAHSLVLYGFAGIYVLAALVLDGGSRIPSRRQGLSRLRALLMDLAVICLTLVVFSNASTANRASMNLYLRYENNYSMANSVITQIEALPGFTADTPVLVVGRFPVTNDYDRILDVNHITGVSEHATRGWEPSEFMKYYCGADFEYLSLEQNQNLLMSPGFRAMPFFPDQGSIGYVDGTVVVKLDPWSLPEEFVSLIQPDQN